MIIKNKTKGTILSTSVVEATTFKHKALGLILSNSPQSMIFQTRFGIHTFLMKFPIDAIILDNNHKVVALKKKLQPNRIFLWNPKYKTVLELPADTIKETNTSLRDIIEFPQQLKTR